MKDIASYVDTPHWNRLKRVAMERCGGACEKCGAALFPGNRHLHHLTYAHVGAERPADVVYLCVACHSAMHPTRRFRPAPKGFGKADHFDGFKEKNGFARHRCEACGRMRRIDQLRHSGAKYWCWIESSCERARLNHRRCEQCHRLHKVHHMVERDGRFLCPGCISGLARRG
jgi:hypothetical protein